MFFPYYAGYKHFAPHSLIEIFVYLQDLLPDGIEMFLWSSALLMVSFHDINFSVSMISQHYLGLPRSFLVCHTLLKFSSPLYGLYSRLFQLHIISFEYDILGCRSGVCEDISFGMSRHAVW
jgi:hypothetical protein